MKKNYLKPLCAAAPMDGLQLMDGSIPLDTTQQATTQFSREMIDEPAGMPSQNSVWDD